MAGAYFDPEYETLHLRINPPRVTVDNISYSDFTIVKVDSQNKPGILLEVVQILTDLDLVIRKAYICSDGGWFMDVFHVQDHHGKKISDVRTIESIEKALGPQSFEKGNKKTWPGRKVGVHSLSLGDYTTVELIGKDRPGLLSEVSAVLANLRINVVAAEAWTHNRRTACVLYVNDDTTSRAVEDATRLSLMEEQLNYVLRENEEDDKVARTKLAMGFTHTDRRLHQMLFADRDYEENRAETDSDSSSWLTPCVTIENCADKGYSIVNVRSKDRPKLMFDIVCTLTDMQYVVFHATVSSEGGDASQEYFIRHIDGCTLDTEGDREKVRKCLEAALSRRVSEGLSLELCAKDRVGLLSEVTRILRENGLRVTRAGVTTVGEEAVNVFYVRDASGSPVDMKTIEAVRKEIGQTMMVNVKKTPSAVRETRAKSWPMSSFFFGNLFERFLA